MTTTWCAEINFTYTHRAKATKIVSIVDRKYGPLETLPAFVLEYLDSAIQEVAYNDRLGIDISLVPVKVAP